MAFIIQFMWEGLGNLLFSIGEALHKFFSNLSLQIYVYLIQGLNSLIGGLEFILNVIRNYLPLVITVVLTWFMASKIMRSETMTIRQRLIGMVSAPFLALIPAAFLDAMLPKPICLPRLEVPTELPPVARTLIEEELFTRPFIEEEVIIREDMLIDEERFTNPFFEEEVIIREEVLVDEEMFTNPFSEESVTIE